MADKRIGQIDEATAFDEDADHILILQGTQRNLRRLLGRRLPGGFDLHDDVTAELISPAGIDRLLISDESGAGFPQRWISLSRLANYLTNAFDLHDDVAMELVAAAANDRMLISDEDQAGDPQKWISVENLFAGALKFEKVSQQIDINFSGGKTWTISHNLGRVPLLFQTRLICQKASSGYSASDEVYLDLDHRRFGSNNSYQLLAIHSATEDEFEVSSYQSNPQFYIPNKDTGVTTIPSLSSWSLGFTIAG